MANEIDVSFDKGSTLYARVFDGTGQVWNTSLSSFEAWNDANVGDYAISLIDMDSGQYLGDFPSAAAGIYKVKAYEQAGGSPATTDSVVAKGQINWDGSTESIMDTNIDAILVDTAEIANLNDITVADILAGVVEGTVNVQQVLRLIISVLACICNGGGTTSINFRDLADTKNRVSETVDTNGNRTSVTLDLT